MAMISISNCFHCQHEDWSADIKGSPADLALLELSTPVTFTDHIQPACLPSSTYQEFSPRDNCWISGWGDTKGKRNTSLLLYIDYTKIGHDL